MTFGVKGESRVQIQQTRVEIAAKSLIAGLGACLEAQMCKNSSLKAGRMCFCSEHGDLIFSCRRWAAPGDSRCQHPSTSQHETNFPIEAARSSSELPKMRCHGAAAAAHPGIQCRWCVVSNTLQDHCQSLLNAFRKSVMCWGSQSVFMGKSGGCRGSHLWRMRLCII